MLFLIIGYLQFSLNDLQNSFQIDVTSGELRIIKLLDENKEYKITVNVSDGKYESSIETSIQSTRNNTYTPTFNQWRHLIKVELTDIRPYPRLIDTLKATDLENNQLSFSFTQSNRFFRIESFSGKIYQLAAFESDFEQLKVAVYDSPISLPFTKFSLGDVIVYKNEQTLYYEYKFRVSNTRVEVNYPELLKALSKPVENRTNEDNSMINSAIDYLTQEVNKISSKI